MKKQKKHFKILKDKDIVLKESCFLCRSRGIKRLFKSGDYTIVRCRRCGMIATINSGLERAFKSDTKVYLTKKYISYYLSRPVQSDMRDRAQKRLTEIEQISPGKKILDVGCGYGSFLQTAKKLGWQTQGVEPCRKTVEALQKKGIKIIKGKLKQLGTAQKFDVVTYWDVLEHIPDPLKELKQARKIMNKGSVLAVQVPNFASLSSKITGSRFVWLCPADHLYHFTAKTLCLVLQKAGFEIVQVKTWSGRKNHFQGKLNELVPDGKIFAPIGLAANLSDVILDKAVPFLGDFFSWLESLFLLNGLLIVYARRKDVG